MTEAHVSGQSTAVFADGELRELQRQAEARAATIWDPIEAAMIAAASGLRSSPPDMPDSDAALAAIQAEATDRALRNWERDELREISATQTAGSLSTALMMAMTDAADDFLQQRLTPMIPGAYREYLRSDHWRAIRQWMLLRAGGACQRCGGRGLLDVHHRDYRRLGAEREADLIVLCRECHSAEHGVAAP